MLIPDAHEDLRYKQAEFEEHGSSSRPILYLLSYTFNSIYNSSRRFFLVAFFIERPLHDKTPMQCNQTTVRCHSRPPSKHDQRTMMLASFGNGTVTSILHVQKSLRPSCHRQFATASHQSYPFKHTHNTGGRPKKCFFFRSFIVFEFLPHLLIPSLQRAYAPSARQHHGSGTRHRHSTGRLICAFIVNPLQSDDALYLALHHFQVTQYVPHYFSIQRML